MRKDITNVAKYSEKFSTDFQKYLTPDNTFWLNSKGVKGGTDISVNIPQYSTRISGPADATSNSALTVVDYTQDNLICTAKQFKTNAIRVIDFENTFTANDQRLDVMDGMKGFTDTKLGDFAAYQIAPTGSTFFTSGTDTRESSLEGSGNTVKVATQADWVKIRKAIAKTNIVGGEWHCLISPEFLGDLLNIPSFVEADKTGEAQSRLQNGEFVKILGITFHVRQALYGSSVAYTTGGTKVDVYGAVGAATTITSAHVGAAIFWNTNATYYNYPMSKLYYEMDNAIYQSDIYSMQHAFGMERIRKDGIGVIALIEKK